MTICLNESQVNVLEQLIFQFIQNNNKRRIHFKKNEIDEIFGISPSQFLEICKSLKTLRLIDIPFENNLQIDIYVYNEMIEEQLANNRSYRRVYKNWTDISLLDEETFED